MPYAFPSVADFGAVGNGTTDDTVAVQNAVNSLGPAGGTILVPDGFKVLLNGSVSVPENVSLRGPHEFTGMPTDQVSFTSKGGALIIDSTAAVDLGSGASLVGFYIYRKGMTFPAQDDSAFAGTAITSSKDDAAVSHCMILGFNQAISFNGTGRPRLHDLFLDNRNGLLIQTNFDVGYITNCHSWPFASIAASYQTPPGPAALVRTGYAYHFANNCDWMKASNCFSYGYKIGFFLENVNQMTLVSCSSDNVSAQYATGTTGFQVSGCVETQLIACEAAASTIGMRISNAASASTLITGGVCWSNPDHGILIDEGCMIVSGGTVVRRQSVTQNGITINGTGLVSLDGVSIEDFEAGTNPITCVGVQETDRFDLRNVRFKNCHDNPVNGTYAVSWLTGSGSVFNLPNNGKFFTVIGNSQGWGTMSNGYTGRELVFTFQSQATIYSGGSFSLGSGSNVFNPGNTLSLIYDGSVWQETGRKQ